MISKYKCLILGLYIANHYFSCHAVKVFHETTSKEGKDTVIYVILIIVTDVYVTGNVCNQAFHESG